ncbi:MAG: NUDIX hydrolase [Proteobacteria bacterium]|nr:NUDIX hydrolase [Pseudomonadota bacterium]
MLKCESCGALLKPKNPFLTVDIIIEVEDGVVLIERKNEPYGWAIPGGFVDYGETVETSAKREAKEETNLDIANLFLFGVYSDPKRDPRFHTVSVVFVATARGDQLIAGDDAKNAKIFKENELPENIVFDHKKILKDYFRWKRSWI